MRFRAGDSAVDVVVDIDWFELSIAGFLPGIAAGTLESARALLDPGHLDTARGRLVLALPCFRFPPDQLDAARGRLILTIQSFVLHPDGRPILHDPCAGEEKERPLIAEFHRRR